MSKQLIETPATFGENGNFLLERELGAGGMGGVYMGRDKMLDRPVAVKVMLREYGADAEFVEKFKKEAQAAARLIHPNIAQIYSYGISDGMPYIVMELVAGGSLDAVVRSNPGGADVTRVMKICEQVAQALRCASDLGLVHGDVKPENVLLDANGNAKLVDFGLAAMQKDTEEIWGTPYYIAPEKVTREGLDFRADIYSLGGTLYHALTGQPPFEGADANAVVRKRFDELPAKPSSIRPGLSPQIDNLVMKMLAFNKDERFPSFEALLEEFKNVMATGLYAVKPRPWERKPSGNTTFTVKTGARRVVTAKPQGGEGSEAADASESGEKKPKLKLRHHREEAEATPQPMVADLEAAAGTGGGSGVGKKVSMAAGIIIGAIALVGGGLVWYVHHANEVEKAEHQRQVSANIVKARESIAHTRLSAQNFATEFSDFTKRASEGCESVARQLDELIPEYSALLRPEMPQSVRDEIEGKTEEQKAAEAEAAKAAAAKQGGDKAKAASAAGGGAAAPARRMSMADYAKLYGVPPPPDDLDPASPDGEEYMAKFNAAKARYEAAKGAGLKDTAGSNGAAQTAMVGAIVAAATAGDPSLPPPPQVVNDVQALWTRAFECMAAAARVAREAQSIVAACDAADKGGEEDDALQQALARASLELRERYDNLKSCADVDSVRKGVGYIKTKGERAVKETVRRLREEKLAASEKARKEAEAAAEKERLEAQAADRARRVVEETQASKDKFETINLSGCFRQLNWVDAIRQLTVLRDTFTTPEGQLAAEQQLQRVRAMKAVQDIFICNLPGYTFRRSKLKGQKVRDVDTAEIRLVKADGKTKPKVNWVTFYAEYHGNLNELIVNFIENGRNQSKTPDGTLTLKPWVEAMFGAALSMRLICADDPSAVARGEAIARRAYAEFPDWAELAKVMFPDIDFDAAPAVSNESADE